MNYEALLMEADSHQLVVKEKPLTTNDRRIKGKRIAIRKDIETTKEKACVLAENLIHNYTSSGTSLTCRMSRIENRNTVPVPGHTTNKSVYLDLSKHLNMAVELSGNCRIFRCTR